MCNHSNVPDIGNRNFSLLAFFWRVYFSNTFPLVIQYMLMTMLKRSLVKTEMIWMVDKDNFVPASIFWRIYSGNKVPLVFQYTLKMLKKIIEMIWIMDEENFVPTCIKWRVYFGIKFSLVFQYMLLTMLKRSLVKTEMIWMMEMPRKIPMYPPHSANMDIPVSKILIVKSFNFN